MNYVERLEKLGYLKCCAQRIVNDHLEAGKQDDLEAYLNIKEHVAEVLG